MALIWHFRRPFGQTNSSHGGQARILMDIPQLTAACVSGQGYEGTCVLNVAKCLWQFVGPLQHRWPLYSPQKYIINLLANQIGDNNQAQPQHQHQAHSAVCLQDTQATRVVDPLPLQLISVGVECVCVSVYLCVVYVFRILKSTTFCLRLFLLSLVATKNLQLTWF